MSLLWWSQVIVAPPQPPLLVNSAGTIGFCEQWQVADAFTLERSLLLLRQIFLHLRVVGER
jgi:hypothetical protein